MSETAPPQWPEWRKATYRSYLTMIGDTVCVVSLCADGKRWYAWHYRRLGNGRYSRDEKLKSVTGEDRVAVYPTANDAKLAIGRYVSARCPGLVPVGKDGKS